MKRFPWKSYVLWVLLSEGVGALAALLTRAAMARFSAHVLQPPLSPPGWVFSLVWTLLYALMGVGAARVALSPPSPQRTRGLALFFLQLALNFCWSLLFFNAEAYGAALLLLAVLWGVIFGMGRAFLRVDRLAGRLQIPYLLWVTFALYLNAGVWLLNR